jgi:hypothetical protein
MSINLSKYRPALWEGSIRPTLPAEQLNNIIQLSNLEKLVTDEFKAAVSENVHT